MALPYERKTVVTVAGDGDVFQLDYPSRGFIEKILIVKLDGTASGTVDVFNKDPDANDSEEPGDVDDPDDLYRVCAALTLTSGKSLNFFDTPKAFFNNDGATNGRNPSKMYLRFNTNQTGDFAVVVGGTNYLI